MIADHSLELLFVFLLCNSLNYLYKLYISI